jgi:uncharacterized phosphosugar-binding protein
MLIQRYFEALQARIAAIAADPGPIEAAARMCADSLANGGVVHIFDSGHLVSYEMINRAGGPVAFSRLGFALQVDDLVKTRAGGDSAPTLSYGYIQHVFETNQLRPGDVLFVGSVSGKTPNVIELAIQGKAHGLKVITMSSLEYSRQLASEHPSGKHLYEVGDLALDNHAPYGDAMLVVEGMEYPICPASGIGAVVVFWGVVAGMVEEMLGRGLTPTMYPSVNRPHGKELVAATDAAALKKGY